MNYPDKSSQSFALNQRAQRSLPGGNTRTTVFAKPYPLYAARGEGCRVWDVDGAERIDCINNFTAAIHGTHSRRARPAHRTGIAGQTTGMGSLLKMHFTRHPIHDYRSASPDAEARHNMALFNPAALNEGILVSSYGLFALSPHDGRRCTANRRGRGARARDDGSVLARLRKARDALE